MNEPRYFCNDCVIFTTHHLNAQKTYGFDGVMNGKYHVMTKEKSINNENDRLAMGFSSMPISQNYSPQKLNTLFQRGNFTEIVEKSRLFQNQNPKNADVLSLLGVACVKTRQFEKAKPYFEMATKLAPKTPSVWNNFGNILADLGETSQARASYEKALQLNPDYPDALNGYGNVLMHLGEIQDAVEPYQKLLAINPNHPEGQVNLAQAFIAQGEFDAAKKEFLSLIKKAPRHAEAHHQLSRIQRYEKGDDHIKAMQAVMKMPNPSAKETVLINHGLGKAHADLKEYSKAFGYWQAGNQAFKKTINYDFAEDQEVFDRLHQWAESMPILSGPGALKRQPIFILGMPRSGTSLVEQILSGHSKVYAAGELDAMALAVRKNVLSDPNKSFSRLNKAVLKTIRESYIKGINVLPTDCGMITDKMPLNFKWISIIRAIFPDAPILHLKRHPMAICFSNFRYFFQSHGMRYSNNLMDIGQYYLAYDQLMQRHIADHGDAITTIDYEALTQDPKQHIETLLKTLGLGWQDACLNIEDNKRSVKTVSNVQIRSSIYTKSSEEWKNYEKELQPLKQLLMPVLERDGWI